MNRYKESIEDLIEQKGEGFRWLARKNHNWLYTFKDQPVRKSGDWDTDWPIDCQVVESQVGEFYSAVNRDDDEPTDLTAFLDLILKEEA